MAKVLVCGVYLADRENWAAAEIQEFARTSDHQLEQRWIALDITGTGKCDLPCTVATVNQRTSKFTLINELLSELDSFDVLIVSDDDVKLPSHFLDDFMIYVHRFQLALSQPARTHDSYVDHLITLQMPGLASRLTRFVEIGPVFCIHRSAFDLLLPFDSRSPMGWGLDFVWPVLIERNGLRMGIIDATCVGHTLRKPVSHYSRSTAEQEMETLFQGNSYLPIAEAFTVLEAYA